MDSTTDVIVDAPIHADERQTVDRINEQHSNGAWLTKLWQAIVNACQDYDEPMFWRRRDRNGNVYWEGYDPISDRTFCFASDDEARIWLDQIYR